MKNSLKKIISVCLVLSLCFSAIAFGGREKVSAEDAGGLKVFYNRSYEEGWNYTNGLTLPNAGVSVSLDHELVGEGKYNYFLKLDPTDVTNGYVQMGDMSAASSGKMFIEFDIKAAEGCSVGGTVQSITVGTGTDRAFEFIAGVKDGMLQVYGENVCRVDDGWTHVTYEIDWDAVGVNESTNGAYDVTVTVLKGDSAITKSFTKYAGKGGQGFQAFRLGFPSGRSETTIGQWVALDNMKVYSGVDAATELDAGNYGILVNSGAIKDFAIMGGSNEIDYIAQGIVMKVGNPYGLVRYERRALLTDASGNAYGAPVKIDGKVYIPLETMLNYLGAECLIGSSGTSYDVSYDGNSLSLTMGQTSATVDGARVELSAAPAYYGSGERSYAVVALDDLESLFPGYCVTYDKLGLICIATRGELFNRENDMAFMMELMKGFVFEYPDADELYTRVEENTDGFTHPYLFLRQSDFNRLRAAYELAPTDEGYDEFLSDMIERLVAVGRSHYNSYAALDDAGNYAGIKSGKSPVNSYYSTYSDGYDSGGRLSVPTGILVPLAFAYQMTGELKYVRLAYDYIVALGEWEHWGPGHFLNCADASAPIAQAIDWMYPGMLAAGLDPAAVIEPLYTHGTYMGYLSSVKQSACPFPSNRIGSAGFLYEHKVNNWNAVCTSGMIQAALVTMGSQEYASTSAELVSHNLESLAGYGLSEYMPDGSYCESASYWAYGTNCFFEMTAALESAVGSDLGFMNCWGIDTTCYYALHVEDNDFKSWSYHDGGAGSLNTGMFAYVADSLDDDELYAVRINQIVLGKGISHFDVIHYKGVPEGEPDMPLQYAMEGIDGYAVRSSWSKTALYAGIMGGSNSVSHGQLDAGAFVYHNNGKIWFCDLGNDSYLLPNYFANSALYRRNAEGNNVLAFTSDGALLPYGQLKSATAPMISYGDNSHGAYAIFDTTEVYAGKASSAKRGMLFTNDRKTVVIQDEVTLGSVGSLAWIGHYDTATVTNVSFSLDGRIAYMTSGSDVLRVTLLSDNKDLAFEIMDCYDFLLAGTYVEDPSATVKEYDRSNFRRLVVKAEGVTELKMAVVIENVGGADIPTGYELTDMEDWAPYADERSYAVENPVTGTVTSFGAANTDAAGNSVQLDVSSMKNEGLKYHRFTTSGVSAVGSNLFGSLQTSATKSESISHVVYDIDIATENMYYNMAIFTKIDGAFSHINQLKITSDGYIVGNLKSYKLESEPFAWNHLTLILDLNGNKQYAYVNGELIHNAQFSSAAEINSIAELRFNIANGTPISGDSSILFANPVAKYYRQGALAPIFANPTAPLTSQTSCELVYNSSYVLPSPEYIFASGTLGYRTLGEAVAAGESELTLLHNWVGAPFTVTDTVKVNRGSGDTVYSMNYILGEKVIETVTEESYVFTNTDTYTVRYYGYNGELIHTEQVLKGGVATPPTVDPTYLGKRFVGWARSSAATSPDTDLTLSGNTDFYLVYTTFNVRVTVGDTVNEYTLTDLYDLLNNAADGTVIEIFGDVSVSSEKSVEVGNSLTVVIYGSTLTLEATSSAHLFVISGNGALTVRGVDVTEGGVTKSATLAVKTGYNVVSSGLNYQFPTASFENLDVSITGGNSFCDLRQGTLYITDCTVNSSNKATVFKIYTRAGSTATSKQGEPKVVITDSVVHSEKGYVIQLITHEATMDCRGQAEIYGSTVSSGLLPALRVDATDAGAPRITIDGNSILRSPSASVNSMEICHLGTVLTVGVGASFNSAPLLLNTKGSTIVGNGGGIALISETAELPFVAVDGGDIVAYIYNADGSLKHPTTLDKVNANIIDIVPAGGSMLFCKNASLSEAVELRKDITFDLGGNTFTMNNVRFELYSGTLTVKNGSITKTGGNLAYTAGGNSRFVGLEISTSATLMDMRSGTHSFENCVIDFRAASYGICFTVGYNVSDTTVINLSLTDTEWRLADGCNNAILFNLHKGMGALTLTDSSVDFGTGGGTLIRTANVGNHTVSITGCDIRKDTNSAGASIQGSVNVEISESFFDAAPAFGTANVEYAKGETLAALSNGRYKITKPLVTPKANLTLYADFNLNLWLPVDQPFCAIRYGEVSYRVEELQSVDGMYKVVVGGIAANAAADDVTFYISYAEGEEIYTVTLNYSVVKYAASLLGNATASQESKALVASAVDYIGAAYTYAGTEAPEALTALMASENYTAAKADASHDEVLEVPATETNKGDIAAAISSAQLSLGSNLKLVLNLNPEYTGALTLSYAGNTYTYTVEAGKVENATYIELDMRAYDLYDSVINITAGEYRGSYDLKAYAASETVTGDEKLASLVLALYNFCKEADEYKLTITG